MVIGNNNILKSGVALGAMGSESNGLVNPAGVLGLTLQKLPGGLILDLQLQALETEGQAKVISAPKLTVLNNQEALIQQGSEVPYLSAALNGATQVQFKKAVLSLRVRPEVTADHEILMTLQVNKDKVSTISVNAAGTPVIDTREINTMVKVRSGQTIVLGGIEESLDSQGQKGLPGLDKLPGIGWLFRTNSHKHQESEMLIFITPEIEAVD
jgi:type IV pilus assembly protein PilQ